MKRFLITSFTLLSFMTCIAQPGSGYVLDAMQDKYEKEHAGDKQKGMDWMANAMNGKTESSYTFTLAVNMHVTSYKNGEKKDENDMKYFLNAGQKYFGLNAAENGRRKNNDETFIIYDNKNNSMIMLNEKEKTGMAMNINAFMSADAQAKRGQGSSDYKPTTKCDRTGKTKTIQGHSCFEYICTDADRNTRSEFWIATDLNIDIAQSMSRGPFSSFSHAQGAGGFMMEATHYKNDQIESKMEVTEINKNANLNKNMSDYKMGMGGMR